MDSTGFFEKLEVAVELFRGGLAGKRLYEKKEDWILPAIVDLSSMSQVERDVLILAGIQQIGMRQTENEALSAAAEALKDVANLLRGGGLGTAPGGYSAPGGAVSGRRPPWSPGNFVKQRAQAPDGQFYENPAIYRVGEDGALHWVSTPAALARLGGSASNIQYVGFEAFDGLTIGDTIR